MRRFIRDGLAAHASHYGIARSLVSDHSHTLAFTPEGLRMHVMLNAYHERLSFALPGAELRWHLLVNTAAKEPFAEGELSPVSSRSYYVDAHACMLLIDGAISVYDIESEPVLKLRAGS